MEWKKHFVTSEHAFLSASKYHWIRYDDDKLKEVWRSHQAAQEGTELHEYAAKAIKLGIRQKGSKTLASYINDAIGYRMSPEVLLYYSDNCYGTADAIGFDEKTNMLRIHDLKTGKIPAHMEQLMIYSALFCLDYDRRPGEISCELRIYQNDEIVIYLPTTEEISQIISKIRSSDKIINKLKFMEG